MEVIMKPQVLNVKPTDSLQDDNKRCTVQASMKTNTKQGYHSSPLPREATDDCDKHLTSEMQETLLNGLKRVSAVLGLLPGYTTEPEASYRTKAKFCVTFLAFMMVGTPYIIIECYMSPQYGAIMKPVSFLVETVYSWCLTLTGWLIVIGFWHRRRYVPSLLQQFSKLHLADPSAWPHVARVVVVLLPLTLYFLMFTTWYFIYRINIYAVPGVFPLFLVSFTWLHALQAMPFIYCLLLGQFILDSLIANNKALTRALGEAAGEMMLMEIHQRNVALRQLYGELEKVVSLPLLANIIFIIFIVTDNLYFIIDAGSMNGITVYLYFGMLANLLTLVGTGVMCRMADNIKDQVKNI